MKFLHLFTIEVRTLKWTCELCCKVPAQLIANTFRIWKRNWQVDNKLGNRALKRNMKSTIKQHFQFTFHTLLWSSILHTIELCKLWLFLNSGSCSGKEISYFSVISELFYSFLSFLLYLSNIYVLWCLSKLKQCFVESKLTHGSVYFRPKYIRGSRFLYQNQNFQSLESDRSK
jgi:hypothetical protein